MKFGEALEIIKQGGVVRFYKEIVLDMRAIDLMGDDKTDAKY